MYKRILTLPLSETEARKNNRWHRYIAMENIFGQVVGRQHFPAIMNQILSVHCPEPDLI